MSSIPGQGMLTSPDLSKEAPLARFAAGRIAQGDFSPAELSTLSGLGQQAIGGPGARYDVQGDLYRGQHAPHTVTAGDTYFTDPMNPNAPVLHGGDPGTVAADTAQLTSAQKDADLRANIAESATQAIDDFQTIKQIYSSMIGATDVKSVLSDRVVQWLVDHGVPADQLSNPAQAKIAIKQLLASTTKSYLTVAQGDPNTMYRGAVQQAITAMPDPTVMNDQQFNAAIDRMIKIAGRQQAAGGPARTFRNTTPKTPQAMQKYQTDLEAIRQQQEDENRREAAGGGSGGAEEGGAIYVFPDANTANAEVNSGRVPHGSKIKVGGRIIGVVGD
jgi:hypothetical protein